MTSYFLDLKKSARIAFLLNAIASLLMPVFLKQGLDPKLHTLERLAYIDSSSLVWRLCWIVWILAALSLIAYLISWSMLLWQEGRHKKWIILGCATGMIGMVPDAIAETIYLGLLPIFARDPSVQVAIAQTYFDLAQLLTGFLGNGFYCLGGITLSLISLQSSELPKAWVKSSMLVWGFGFGLSTVSLTQHSKLLVIFTALTMGSFILWCGYLGFIAKSEKTP